MEADYLRFAPRTFDRMVHGNKSWINRFRDEALAMIFELPCTNDCYYAPSSTGVYFLIDTERLEVVYIGSSVDIKKRWKGHVLKKLVSSRTINKRYSLAWKPVDTESFANREHEEAFYIALLRPFFNQIARCKVTPEPWKASRTLTSEVEAIGRSPQMSRQECFSKYSWHQDGGI